LEAIKTSRYNPRAWRFLLQLAEDREIETHRGVFWVRWLHRNCLEEYPDFVVNFMERMLCCIQDFEKQCLVLNEACELLENKRPDLICRIKVMKGNLYLEHHKLRDGIQCYLDPMIQFEKNRCMCELTISHISSLDTLLDEKKKAIEAYELLYMETKKEV